jgi:glycerol-3-phosphate acyltransferase PlsX
MGGDEGPSEFIQGVKLALRDIGPSDSFILVGKERLLRALARKVRLDDPRILFRNAEEEIEMHDKPLVFKTKKDASMVVAIDMLKAGEADTMLSAGNTKVLVAASTLKLGRMDGAERPALAAIMPHQSGHYVLMDVGANPESTPQNLVHNAVMGSIYAQSALGVAKPRVGLLTVGTEEGKGGKRIDETHAKLTKLREADLLNYIGPVEGFDMFAGKLDVVIVDGFTGNILLKTVEGMFRMLIEMIRGRIGYNPLYLAGSVALAPLFLGVKNHLRPDENGGAPLIGLKSLVMKTHGSANKNAIRGTLRLGHEALTSQMSAKLRLALAQANAITNAATAATATAATAPTATAAAAVPAVTPTAPTTPTA